MIKWLDYLVWEEFPQNFCRKYDVSKKKWTFAEEPDKESKVSTEDLMFNFLNTFNSEKIRTNRKDFGIELRKHIYIAIAINL